MFQGLPVYTSDDILFTHVIATASNKGLNEVRAELGKSKGTPHLISLAHNYNVFYSYIKVSDNYRLLEQEIIDNV